MWQGSIVSLHIVAEKSAPMDTVTAVHAIPGKGLKGDRYAMGEELTPSTQRTGDKLRYSRKKHWRRCAAIWAFHSGPTKRGAISSPVVCHLII